MRAYRTLGELLSTAARGGSMREDRIHLVSSFQGVIMDFGVVIAFQTGFEEL